MIEFKMPSLGADMDAGTLREWRVKVGDTVKRGDIIAEVGIQKGVVEIEIFDEGVVEALLVNVDETVPVGKVMALINDGKDAPQAVKVTHSEASKSETAVIDSSTAAPPTPPPPPSPAPAPTPPTPPPPAAQAQPSYSPQGANRIKVSPLARRIAEENGIDLGRLVGTGEEGAITRADVERAISERQAPPPQPVPAPSTVPQPAEASTPPKQKPTVDASAIRRAVAAAMGKSNREIPHYYLETAIDMTKALNWLTAYNKNQSPKNRLLSAVLLIKATAKALEQVPELNATWENDALNLKKDIHVGFVVSLKGGGIIVPAIHHTNLKTLPEIMETLNDLIPRARQLRLRSSELSDSTVTVTSLGDNASDKVFGVIYPPQVAIVGFGSIGEKPFVENGMLGIRQVMHATLAGDHRASDGLTGSKFLSILKNLLQNPETL